MRMLSCLIAAAVLAAAVHASAGDVKLPAPQKTGGPGLFDAVNQRGSALSRGFPAGKPTWNDFSTILWAASGLNRDGGKWTVPMAIGKPPYCKLYLVVDEGAFLYDWKDHVLKQVSAENLKAAIPTQDFAKTAPACLYLVTDGEALAALPPPIAGEVGLLLVGSMSQNIYLAADAVGVGARLIYSIDRKAAAENFKLNPSDVAICTMVLGKK